METKAERIWKQIREFESDIYSYLKESTGDGEIARDLCQDVYLSALSNLSVLDESRSLKNWMYAVARNRVINYLKSKRRRLSVELTEEMLVSSVKDNFSENQVMRIINTLPETQKNILIMREYEGHSYQQISKLTGISIQAVTSALKRARENFSARFLLQFFPRSLQNSLLKINAEDVLRLINPFDPPYDLMKVISDKLHRYLAGIGANWDAIRERFIPENELNSVIGKFNPAPKDLVLDLGCGTGVISSELAKNGARVIAIDKHPKMLSVLNFKRKNESRPGLWPLLADMYHIPLKSNSVNMIVLILVLHHLPDPLGYLSEVTGYMEKGGTILIIDFERHREKELADEMRDLWLGFNPETIKKTLKKQGLQAIHGGSIKNKQTIKVFYQIWKK